MALVFMASELTALGKAYLVSETLILVGIIYLEVRIYRRVFFRSAKAKA